MSVIYALLQLTPMLLFVGAMIWGFKIAGRRVENIFLQLLLGAVLGLGILLGVAFVIGGILFGGCLITGAPSFH